MKNEELLCSEIAKQNSSFLVLHSKVESESDLNAEA